MDRLFLSDVEHMYLRLDQAYSELAQLLKRNASVSTRVPVPGLDDSNLYLPVPTLLVEDFALVQCSPLDTWVFSTLPVEQVETIDFEALTGNACSLTIFDPWRSVRGAYCTDADPKTVPSPELLLDLAGYREPIWFAFRFSTNAEVRAVAEPAARLKAHGLQRDDDS